MNANKLVLPNEILLGEVKSLLQEGSSVVLMTKGSSMMPFIRGDKDSVLLTRKDHYELGEAVLAEIRPGLYVLHRLVELDGDKVTLQGDGNLKGQEHCLLENVCGSVDAIVTPRGRHKSPANDRAKRWRKLPLVVRRYTLAIKRRLVYKYIFRKNEN